VTLCLWKRQRRYVGSKSQEGPKVDRRSDVDRLQRQRTLGKHHRQEIPNPGPETVRLGLFGAANRGGPGRVGTTGTPVGRVLGELVLPPSAGEACCKPMWVGYRGLAGCDPPRAHRAQWYLICGARGGM
jgi:hypothetical protein